MRTPTIIHYGAALLLVASLAGCATASGGSGQASGAAATSDPASQAFYYRQQAAELTELANRLELEAQWYARRHGEESEPAKRAREMAKEMRLAAEEADQLARE